MVCLPFCLPDIKNLRANEVVRGCTECWCLPTSRAGTSKSPLTTIVLGNITSPWRNQLLMQHSEYALAGWNVSKQLVCPWECFPHTAFCSTADMGAPWCGAVLNCGTVPPSAPLTTGLSHSYIYLREKGCVCVYVYIYIHTTLH